MSLHVFDDFRSNVVWRPTHRSFPLSLKFQFGRQTEVTKLQFHPVVDEEVAQLDIPMDNHVVMEIAECLHQLIDVILNFGHSKLVPFLDELVHVFVRANLEQNEHFVLIFEYVIELYDIFVSIVRD